MKKSDPKVEAKPSEQDAVRKSGSPYQPPRIVKKRAVSKATLFTGSGPSSGGVIGSDG